MRSASNKPSGISAYGRFGMDLGHEVDGFGCWRLRGDFRSIGLSGDFHSNGKLGLAASSSPPVDVPSPRWRRFIDDCHYFLAAPGTGAERAAQLGWDAQALFACHRTRPLMYLSTAGLLWAVNGGRVVSIYRDWAVIEGPDGSRRVFHRRQMDAANVTLPWIGPRRLRVRSPGRTPAP